MSKIINIDNLEIYKVALILAKDAYTITKNPRLIKDFLLTDQIRRAAISVPANIAEGFGRKTSKDFSQYLSISLGSINELFVYFDFISLEYNLDTKTIKEKYDILAKRIFVLRKYLINPKPSK